ncbi:putative ion channel [Lineolata rhizophorae]|uniref:Putative ion channel n=1 Tax=Lineolata rhizophorae TaxID=578093 RepID=A0A6A6NV44_9PEZI|nr:putative ion channel [Lineolata rhizophorae]
MDDNREALLRAGERVTRRAKWAWEGFTEFALQDNVLEVAVGLIIANAFNAIVSSLTTDLILPVFALLPFVNRNLEEKFAVLRSGHHEPADGYNTAKQAREDAATVLAWGSFLDKVVRFLVIATSLYLIAQIYDLISSDSIIKTTVKCRFCRKRINEKALRCVNCTSWQDGRED